MRCPRELRFPTITELSRDSEIAPTVICSIIFNVHYRCSCCLKDIYKLDIRRCESWTDLAGSLDAVAIDSPTMRASKECDSAISHLLSVVSHEFLLLPISRRGGVSPPDYNPYHILITATANKKDVFQRRRGDLAPTLCLNVR